MICFPIKMAGNLLNSFNSNTLYSSPGIFWDKVSEKHFEFSILSSYDIISVQKICSGQ